MQTMIISKLSFTVCIEKIAKWKKKLNDMKSHKKATIPVAAVQNEEVQPAVTKAAVPVAKRKLTH